MDLFYTDLIEKYSDKVIYIDVDRFILNISKSDFQYKTHIEEIYDFDFDVSFFKYFYIENLKKYLFQEENGEISITGFNKKFDVLLFVKKLIRERKLENLGI
jgi:lipopolysaccharide biosynthesis glycosyltransferase